MYQIYTADIAALCLSILIHYILHIVAVPRIPVCRYPPKQPEDQRQFPHRPNQSEWISARDFFRLLYGCLPQTKPTHIPIEPQRRHKPHKAAVCPAGCGTLCRFPTAATTTSHEPPDSDHLPLLDRRLRDDAAAVFPSARTAFRLHH